MEPDAFTALSAELAVAAGSVKYRRHSWDSTRHSAAAAHGTHPLSVLPSDVRPLWQRPLDEGAASETDKHRRGRGGGGGEGARTHTALAARARPLLPSPSCRRRSSCSYSLSFSLLCSLFLLFLLLAWRDIGLPDFEAPLVGGTVMAPARHLPSTHTDGGTDP